MDEAAGTQPCCDVVVDVARFALEGEAVEGNDEALYSAVLCSPKGILEMLWAEAGGSCCRCWGKVRIIRSSTRRRSRRLSKSCH